MTQFIGATAKFGIKVNEVKNMYMVLGKSKSYPPIIITVNGICYEIKHTNTTRYLGFRFNSHFQFKSHLGHAMRKIYELRPLIISILKGGNTMEAKEMARSFLYGGLNYGLDVLPEGTDSDYSHINSALISIGCDILIVKRVDQKYVAYRTIFHTLGWLELFMKF